MAFSAPKDAVIAWEGNSKEVITAFPDAAKYNLGFDLRLLQQGQQPTDYRPMSSVGPGVFELRDQDAGMVSRDLSVESSRCDPCVALF
jgi:phage-related protein